MKKVCTNFVVALIAVLVIPSFIRTALAPTAMARYRMSNPLVASGSSDRWYYPAEAAQASSTPQYPIADGSASARNVALTGLQPTAVTPWVRPIEMMQPVRVRTRAIAPFSAASSFLRTYQQPQTQIVRYIPEPNSLEDAKNIFKNYLGFNPEGRTKLEIKQAYMKLFYPEFSVIYETQPSKNLKKALDILVGNNEFVLVPQEPTALMLEDEVNVPVVEKTPSALDEVSDFWLKYRKEQEAEIDRDLVDQELAQQMLAQESGTKNERDEYAGRKQRLKDAIMGLLTQYALDTITEDDLDQKKEELIAEFADISKNYSWPLKQEVSSDIRDLQNEYQVQKKNVKRQKQEFQRSTQLQPVFLHQGQSVIIDEDMLPEEVITHRLKFDKNRPVYLKPRAPRNIDQEIVSLPEEEILYAIPKPTALRNLQGSNIPQLAQEEWEQTPGLAKRWVEKSNMVQSELNPLVPRAEDVLIATPKIIYSVQTAEQKKLMRDKIHKIHAPFIVQQLHARGHRGMVPKSLVQQLFKQQAMEQISSDDLFYLQGVVQTNFLS